MRALSSGFIEALNNDEREYLAFANIALASGTLLQLNNSQIWSGGFSYEEAVSSDDSFTALGSTIIGSATLIINNIYDDFSDYIFEDAEVELILGMNINNQLDSFLIGKYTVDEATYNGATIQLKLLDYMAQFDRPYSLSTLRYPATLEQIFTDVCLTCGVQPETFSFPRRSYVVQTRPVDEALTCRDVLSWIATIADCFAKCTPDGRMELLWFDYDSLDDIDPQELQPWNTGTIYDSHGVHYLYNLHSQNVNVNDTVITGVTVNIKTEAEDVENGIIPYPAQGSTEGFVITVNDNRFITETYAQTIADELGHNIIGTRFRKLNITQASDPSIQAGDVAIVWDRKGNAYKILVTRVAFAVGGTQTIVCGSETPSRNSATQYSSPTKAYVESRKMFLESMTAADSALESAIEAGLAAREAQNSASQAKTSADEALASAISATNSANNALVQLSIVEDVAGTLSWISENGDFVLTNDDHVYAGVVYFIEQNGTYIPISNPDQNANPAQEGWYILDVTESQSKYIMAHLAVTNAGLWVLPVDQIVTHALADSSGNLFVDSDDNVLVDYSTKDPQHAPGYKVLLSAEETENFPVGMTIYDDTGQVVANYGLTVQIGAETGNHIMIDTDSVDIMSDDETYVAKFGVETVIYSTNGTELAHFGYDMGTSSSAYNRAPYYTLGERISTADPYSVVATYDIGDLCVYNDVLYVCIEKISTAEAWNSSHWQRAIGNYSTAIGYQNIASGYVSYAEGYNTKAIGPESHAEGLRTMAINAAHAEGSDSVASGAWSHAEGGTTAATGNFSHSEGAVTEARGAYSHAEGYDTVASHNSAHAEGYSTNATGAYSHAEGNNTTASGSASHAGGTGTVAQGQDQTVIGRYNKIDNNNAYLFIVGGGLSDASADRKNVFTVSPYGDVQGNTFSRISGKPIYYYNETAGYYGFGNNSEITRINTKTTGEDSTGTAFIIANGYYAVGSVDDPPDYNSGNVYVSGGRDSTSRWVAIPNGYNRTATSSYVNLKIDSNGKLGKESSSSIRYKHDVEYLTNEKNSVIEDDKKLLSKNKDDSDILSILNIPVVRFKYNEGYMNGDENYDYSKSEVGFIAEDIDKICPDCVVYVEDETGNKVPESYDLKSILVRTVYTVQKQEERIKHLEEENLQLKYRLDKLEELIKGR